MRSPARKPTVAVAGASGFIGRRVCEALSPDFNVVGLTRFAAQHRTRPASEVRWAQCDLFTLHEVEAALAGCDFAIYLVHSMMPRTRLTQGTFADIDLLLADNFARAAATVGVQQIVYLGGLLPDDQSALSDHLASRREVETALGHFEVPVTVLRAGLILGAGGSSAEIMKRLASRLPVMVCPKWVDTATQPVCVDDVVRVIKAVTGNGDTYDRIFDVGGPQVVTYRWLLRATADALGQKHRSISVPFLTPRLSNLWVQCVTGAPRSLVTPLIDSLSHEMTARDSSVWTYVKSGPGPLTEGLSALAQQRDETPRAFTPSRSVATDKTVFSVQRIPCPREYGCDDVAAEYVSWLPRYMRRILTVKSTDLSIAFYVPLIKTPILVLKWTDETGPLYTSMEIVGGLLVRPGTGGRLVFRTSSDDKSVLVSIHHYVPRLRWQIYTLLQAPFHLWVMSAFSRHLRSLMDRRLTRESTVSSHA